MTVVNVDTQTYLTIHHHNAKMDTPMAEGGMHIGLKRMSANIAP